VLSLGVATVPPRALAQEAAVAEDEEVAADDESMADIQPAGELKTVAVAALSGYDALMADVSLLSELGGRPEGAKMVEGMLALFTQGRGLEGLAKDRPIGVVLQTDGAQFIPLVCVPVTNVDSLLELVTGFGFEPVDAGNGITEIELPDQTIYVKEAGEWAFVAQTPAALEAAPEDPSAAMSELVGQYDVGVRVAVQNVPEMYRTIAIEQMREGMEQGMQRMDDESDEAFEKRQALATAQIEQVAEMIESLDELTLGWSLDNQQRTTHLDIAFTALPDTLLAKGVACYTDTKTDFAGFTGEEAAASFQLGANTPEEVMEQYREQLEAGIEVMRTQAEKAIDESEDLADDEESRTTLKSAVADLIDVYEALAFADHNDLAGSLQLGTLGGGSGEPGVVVGGFVPETEKLLSALKKVAEVAKKEEPTLADPEWDYATHAGVKLSRVTLPVPNENDEGVPMPPALREAFGENVTIVLGLAEDAAYLAAGPAAEEQLKSAIDESAGRQGEACTPVVAELSVRQFLLMAQKVAPDDEGKKVVNMIVDAFKDVPSGKDHLRATVKPIENGMTVRYEAEEGVLQAIGEGVSAAQKAQQAGEF
jgi:phosphosulfolactate synthase (CoM biosynthesis protein A)